MQTSTRHLFPFALLLMIIGVRHPEPALASETIFQAAEKGDLAEVQRHLNSGAAVNGRDEETGATPLLWAAGFGHLDVVKFLV